MSVTAPPLHVVVLNYTYDPGLASADAALDRYFALTGWAEGLRAAGARVTIVQRFHHDAHVERGGADYHFVADRHRPWLRRWQAPRRLHRRVWGLCSESVALGQPTVVHVNGLLFPLATRLLAASLPPECALVAQHHAERPWRGLWGLLQRWGLVRVDGFFFAARELAQEWIEQGCIRTLDAVHEVMELSSPFRHQDRAAARAITGLAGDPVVLWTGNLYPNKDPLTILAGFERLLARAPQAQLYMAYRYASLLPQVQARIASSPALRPAVTLLGEIPREKIAAYYNSADLFVQGSAREAAGAALLDALACGVVPVVTDIPSFRILTDGGRIGALWPVGSVDGFSDALLRVVERPLAPASEQARRFFAEKWSAVAIGHRAVAAYRQALGSG